MCGEGAWGGSERTERELSEVDEVGNRDEEKAGWKESNGHIDVQAEHMRRNRDSKLKADDEDLKQSGWLTFMS